MHVSESYKAGVGFAQAKSNLESVNRYAPWHASAQMCISGSHAKACTGRTLEPHLFTLEGVNNTLPVDASAHLPLTRML